MSKQSLFDFDGTITTKDTLVILIFELLKLRPARIFRASYYIVGLKITVSASGKQKLKNTVIGCLIKDLSEEQLNGALRNFRRRVSGLYRPAVINEIHRAVKDGGTAIVVTASPTFAVQFCLSDLPVLVLGTEFEMKQDLFTGCLEREGCYGAVKAERVRQWAAANGMTLNIESAWSDHLSDADMLMMAANRYWIGDEGHRKIFMERDPEGKFILSE